MATTNLQCRRPATLTHTAAAPQPVTVVPKSSDPRCVDTKIGWALDFDSTPKKIVLCPDTCALQMVGVFQLTVGCVTPCASKSPCASKPSLRE